MIFLRRRLFFWLIRAYIKRWGKRIIFFFLLGLIIFFIALRAANLILPKIPLGKYESIGITGAYTLDSLPDVVMKDISYGLTLVSGDGIPKPGAAEKWSVQNNGKFYVFYLKPNLRFSDGTLLTSSKITYPFSDATIERPSESVIIFKLKESYSPFLITVSRPIVTKNFAGLGNYRVKNVDLNGDFVKSITLTSQKNRNIIKSYHFYPNETSLKLAFVLGEITKALGLSDVSFKESSLSRFSNTAITKQTDYSQLVTLFYNIKDTVVSNDKLRSGISYTIPDSFPEGERAYTPFSPNSWVYTEAAFAHRKDLELAKVLIKDSFAATGSAKTKLVLKTLSKYKKIADNLTKIWETAGISATVETVDSIPSQFQLFLGDFVIPKDPDQYMLWHTAADYNITGYSDLRIDKLLEDGRQTAERNQRKNIYADFQKYLLADSPATFLYFPYVYEVTRK